MKILRTCVMTLCIFLGTTFTGQAQTAAIPRIWSMTANENARTANTISFSVTFSEAVTGVDVSDFATAGDNQYASISQVAPTDRADTYLVELMLSGPAHNLHSPCLTTTQYATRQTFRLVGSVHKTAMPSVQQ